MVVRPLNESTHVYKSSYDYEPKQANDGIYGVLKHMTDYPANNGLDDTSTVHR